jgi:preprotein translocase subunit YajC
MGRGRFWPDSPYPELAKSFFLPSLPRHFPTGETPMLNAFVSLPTAIQPLWAQATQPDPRAQMMSTLGMLVMMMVVVWFMIIRPQRRKAKEQTELLKNLKANDKVVTSSGIIGIVTSVRDDSVTIRSGEAKLEVQKSAVTQVVEKSA